MKSTTINLKGIETFSYAIVVIGGGLAGILASIIAAREGRNVAVITKKKPGKASSTAYSMGRFSVAGTKMTKEEHLEKSLMIGEYLNDKELLEKMTEEAPQTFECLREELNLTFSSHDMGYIVADGEKPLPGANLMEKLVYKAMEQENIDFYSNCLPLELIEKDGICGGVLAVDSEGKLTAFRSEALLISSGGYAGAFANTDNPPTMMGEGLILGYRAGCALRDLEFVQFYPLGFKEEKLPSFIAPPRYPPTALLYNDSGEDIIKKYLGEDWDINSATIGKRGALSIALETEWQKEQVWMDLTKCVDTDWKGVNSKPLYDRYNFDFSENPFRWPYSSFYAGWYINGRLPKYRN
ncbi:FAD-binding protein [Natranaerofaba carboxydovora]|uniref:FAD-binding protein n=1 Tax=Natranaerofaba carboxydovora TaxID=2742683 RepID=UPI002402670E|nr:FAD-binding protein [Natranaerofaba carboxydovora]UMZ74930.1 Fumarate reductase flavoprotein subunit [Natranaerofaba carboxydovora]